MRSFYLKILAVAALVLCALPGESQAFFPHFHAHRLHHQPYYPGYAPVYGAGYGAGMAGAEGIDTWLNLAMQGFQGLQQLPFFQQRFPNFQDPRDPRANPQAPTINAATFKEITATNNRVSALATKTDTLIDLVNKNSGAKIKKLKSGTPANDGGEDTDLGN